MSSIPPRQDVLYTTLCDKVCHWLATGRWFSLGAKVSPTNKTDSNNVAEILLQEEINKIRLKYFFL